MRHTLQIVLLYSWRFSCHSAPIHWLVHGHMTSNNETVFRQMPWAGDIAKTMTSNEKQFTVTREMLTTVAHNQRWPEVVTGISARFSKVASVLFCYITNHFSSRETLRFSGNKIHCSSRDQSLSVKCIALELVPPRGEKPFKSGAPWFCFLVEVLLKFSDKCVLFIMMGIPI